MTTAATAPAILPPGGLPGLQAEWSRLVSAPDSAGATRTWHVLDNRVEEAEVTLLCVHGNPTWSYLWRDVLAAAPAGVRVVAVDHLDMGFSERTGTVRRLAQRIDDLDTIVAALHIEGPVVIVAQDWGGPIALGWAGRHIERMQGIVLMNTAVHHPSGTPAPALIRMARTAPLLSTIAAKTGTFINGTLRLARPPLSAEVKRAYRAPYLHKDRRKAVAEFVADIPLEDGHPSRAALDGVVDAVGRMGDLPVLLLWGAQDPVFSDRYLQDFLGRWPDAQVHRYPHAGHLTPEDADIATPIFRWLAGLGGSDVATAPASGKPLWSEIDCLRHSRHPAVIEMAGSRPSRTVTWAELAADVEAIGAGLVDAGVQSGDRVSLLVPPGVDLTACLYACWRIGAIAVIADAGLGARGMTRALRSAAPDYIIGIDRAMAAARTLRWPGKRVVVGEMTALRRRALGVWRSLDEIRSAGADKGLPEQPAPDDVAAVVFTSGATGPAKGVVYRHWQAQAQRDALVSLYEIDESDRLVAAFAPFALYGAAIGIPSVVPDMDVTKPSTLSASALAGAVAAIDATMVFASPAALVNIVNTATELSPRLRLPLLDVRLLMSAGAPVPAALLRRVAGLVPNAELHTPYGMTEVLPVADISLGEIERAGEGNGVCVGPPIAGVEAAVDPLDAAGRPAGELSTEPEIVGEICVRAAHARDHYDKLWETTRAASQPEGWHRTGDVGHLDSEGRLWVEGRMVHIILTADGVVTPVGVEHAAEAVAEVAQAAAVGIGPAGTQQVVVVVVRHGGGRSARLAPLDVADQVRARVQPDIAAVLEVPALPVDRRHNSKINRTRVAAWAERVLSGGKVGRL